ncbi:hypothetical protein HFK18_16560|uniref:hypothetical protein n=1 Tax=Stenotrophomonas TaxID=40323 RepID=UPI0015D1FED4|nr:hypothetical protein [Stenotrophomonas sp. SbOxS2]NYU00088.1 hypothetical protein [Stenotrophomonas sp. SbOxS2]
MAVYVVTWNLNREANYDAKRTAFLKQVNQYQNVADPGLESVRWISSNLTPDALTDDLKHPLDKNDRLFVARITTGSHQGWLNKATWDWINQRL